MNIPKIDSILASVKIEWIGRMPDFNYTIPNFGETIRISGRSDDNEMQIRLSDQRVIGFPLENNRVTFKNNAAYNFTAYGKSLSEDPTEITERFVLAVQKSNNGIFFNLNFYGDEDDQDYTLYRFKIDEDFAKKLNVICKALSVGLLRMPSQEEVNRIASTHDFQYGDEITFSTMPSNTSTLNTRNIPAGSTNSVMMNGINYRNTTANVNTEFNTRKYTTKRKRNNSNELSRAKFARSIGEGLEGGRKRVVRKTRKGRKGVK